MVVRRLKLFIGAVSFSLVLLFVSADDSYAQPIATSFQFPLDPPWSLVTQGFGLDHWNPRWCGYHLAEDIRRFSEVEVNAAAAGIVKLAEWKNGYGYMVIIEHKLPEGDPDGPFVTTLYGHLRKKDLISPNTEVAKGQTIGFLSEDPDIHGSIIHLHFGIRSGSNGSSRGLRFESLNRNDPRTKKWFYAGYTVKDTCKPPDIPGDRNDPLHQTIISEWFPPAEFIAARSAPEVSALAQQKTDGTTVIPFGGLIDEDTVVLKGVVTDPDGNLVGLEAELQPIGTDFTGIPNCTATSPVSSGETSSVICSDLVSGSYHWQGRGRNSNGVASNWLSAGGNAVSDTDLIVQLTSPEPGVIAVDRNVDSIAIDGSCTLREAIINANNDNQSGSMDCSAGDGADTIILPAGIYTLAISGDFENAGATGDLDITDDLTIVGADAATTIIDGDFLDRVIQTIGSDTELVVNDITIRKGDATFTCCTEIFNDDPIFFDGGGIFAAGPLTINNSMITSNKGDEGGGIFAAGPLIINSSLVTGNTGIRGGGIVGNNITLIDSHIDGNIGTSDGGGIFYCCGDATFSINDSSVSNNRSGDQGGGIHYCCESGTLTLTDSDVSNNVAKDQGGGIFFCCGDDVVPTGPSTISLTRATIDANRSSDQGAGIFYCCGGVLEDAVDLTETVVSNNRLVGGSRGQGGGMFICCGGIETTITSSTISNNTVEDTPTSDRPFMSGGGLWDGGGTTTITNSTITGNSVIPANSSLRVEGGGGGIKNTGTLTLFNSTVSGNTAIDGGGISNRGEFIVHNSTVSNNLASMSGGGIYQENEDAIVEPINSIISGNAAPVGPDCLSLSPVTSLGHNLIGEATECNFVPAFGDLIGSAANPTDPMLGPLQDNRGPTLTHALLPGSPAIDAGDDSICPEFDQRGVHRPIDGNNDTVASCDIGAFEFDPNVILVTKTADTNDGICDSDCSLREAISVATPGRTIELPAGVYTLTLGSELVIDKAITLAGESANDTVIQASSNPNTAGFRVFQIGDPDVGNSDALAITISDVTIRHGSTSLSSGGGIKHNGGALTLIRTVITENNGTSGGGIINNAGPLTLLETTVSNNTSEFDGGGIWNNALSPLTIEDSTISGNASDSDDAGGIWHSTGPAVITNSTVSGNTAFDDGGGIFVLGGSVRIDSSTITENVANGFGGGFFDDSSGSALTIQNSIMAQNFAAVGPDCSQSFDQRFRSKGFNLMGNLDDCNFDQTVGDVVGTISDPVDPRLGPLRDNGGSTLTHALLLGSNAIDAGNNDTCPELDQRGTERPLDGDGDGVGICDIGSFEGTEDLVIPSIEIQILESPEDDVLLISDEPAMPNIRGRAGVVGVNPDPTATTEFDWTVELTFRHSTHGGNDERVQNFLDEQTVIGGDFLPSFGNMIRGGDLTLKVAAIISGQQVEAETNGIRILGTNPTRQDIQTLLAEGQSSDRAITLQKLACQESRQRQFDAVANGGIGIPLFGPPDGWGVMQLDAPPTRTSLWDWRENVRFGKQVFNDKEGFATAYPAVVRGLSQFSEAVDHLNIVRAVLGQPPIEVVIPEFTAEQIELDTLRLYNGIAGEDQWGRPDKLHEFELAFKSVNLPDGTQTQVLDVDESTGSSRWVRVSPETRIERGQSPINANHVNNVLQFNPSTCTVE